MIQNKLVPVSKAQFRDKYAEARKQEKKAILETTLISRLKQCGQSKNLQGGKILHSNAVETGYHRNRYVATALITMYSSCSRMQDARKVFEEMIHHDVVSWTAFILGYVENGESLFALDLFNKMDCSPDKFTYVAALKACACLATEKKLDKKSCLQKGMTIHREAREQGFHTDNFVASSLVKMYSKCGDMLQARDVFNGLIHRNVVSWNSLILGYIENGESLVGLEVFNSMNCAQNCATFVAALKACTSLAADNKLDKKICLQKGVEIHRRARENGFEKDVFVASSLINMYCKCGDMLQARHDFDMMMHRSVVSWNVLIQGYVENGESLEALDMFNRMDCAPNRVTFVAALKACAGLITDNKLDKKTCLMKGVNVHEQVRRCGFEEDVYVGSTLVDMYRKCGDMLLARSVFDRMRQRDVVTWNALIIGYVENGESLVALDMFRMMDCAPDRFTFVAALKACTILAVDNKLVRKTSLQQGVSIHTQARQRGFDTDVFVASTLVDMYSKLGNMLQARDIFDRMMHRNAVSWNALLLGYVQNGEGAVALDMFRSMDCAPDAVTFVAALKACAAWASDKKTCLRKLVNIHRQARECGFEKDVFVESTLVDMYRKCGDMTKARDVFNRMTHRNTVSWNALMLGYVENGESLVALDLFDSMGCTPCGVTFVAVLKACACLASENKLHKEACLQRGIDIHTQAKKVGFDRDVFVANTLVDMYSKCGDMLRARDVFEGMMERDVVSWTSLILGYLENGENSMVLYVFNSMDCAPDRLTFVAVLKACASLGALEVGQRIHNQVHELGLEQDVMVASCLVDFYGKCGNMVAAEEVFNRVHSKDIVCWTALLGGYSLLGDTSQVFSLVKRMEDARLQMDYVTMLLMLTTCSHAGMVEEGQSYFESMSKYGITPRMEHYTCMVDMLGRANKLQEALSLVRSMPFEADSPLWMTLLGACRKWINVEIGKVAFRALVALNDKEHIAAAHVLMRNIYEKLGMQEEGERIKKEMRDWKKIQREGPCVALWCMRN